MPPSLCQNTRVIVLCAKMSCSDKDGYQIGLPPHSAQEICGLNVDLGEMGPRSFLNAQLLFAPAKTGFLRYVSR